MTTIAIKKQEIKPTVVLLSAGIGTRIKSNEPRALIKYKNATIIEHQINTISNSFNECEIVVVCGYDAHKVIKKLDDYKNVRIVENENYKTSGSASSMRLGVNNITNDKVLVIHGDLIFNANTLYNLDYRQSFILVDNREMIKSREVGVVVSENNCAANFAFGIPTKWCQIAYFTGNELKRLKRAFNRNAHFNKKQLTFEVLNKIVNDGGRFKCHEPKEMEVFEVDSMKEYLDSGINI